MRDLGEVRPGKTIYVPFYTFDSNDPQASVTISGLAVTDIEIYKDSSMVQRASDSGYTLLDTDGIDLDGTTGVHGVSIDLSDNTTAGFYAAGSQYRVVIASITVDAATVNFIPVTFTIGYPDAVINTTIATLSTQTNFTLTNGPAEDDALNGCPVIIHDVASAVQLGSGIIVDYVGSTKTVTLEAGTTFTVAATDNIAIYPPLPLTAAALANFQDMYDGTGYSDDTAPASRAQLEQLSVTGAAVNVSAKSAPDGFVLTTGSEVNDEDSTQALDGIRHELTDAAGTLDGYYKFDIGADSSPTSATIKAVINGGNDTFNIYVNTGTQSTPTWSQRGSVTGTSSANNVVNTYDLFASDVVSDLTNEVWIRINGTGLTTSSFDIDQMFVSKAIVPQFSGYDNGMVWVDTVGGTDGVVSGYNGIASRPASSFANALTIASNVGLNAFSLKADSSITLTATLNSAVIRGFDTAIALGGQDVSACHFFDMDVTGIGTGSDEINFHSCHINAVTAAQSHFYNCGFTSTLTLSASADYIIADSYSEVAGAGAPVIDMGAAVGATNLAVRNWAGGLTINNLAAGDVVTLDGVFGTITLNGADAQVEIRGIAKAVVNNLTGSPTVNDDSLKEDDIASILADTNELQGDWTDGGRLDTILDELTTQGDTNESKIDIIDANVDAVLVDTGTTLPASIATIDTNVDAILVDTGTTLPGIIDDLAIKKNTAFSNFEFLMVLASDGRTPATGLTVTGQRSIDGGAFTAVSGTIAEVSNGIYQFDALAADTNGDVITWRFLSATADDTFITFKTVQ